MKSHVISPVPERVLSYGIDEAVQPLLSAVLQEFSIEERCVSPQELGQEVGYLAGFPGFEKKEETTGEQLSCGGVICFCGISNARINTLLKTLNEKKALIPLKAVVTATNQRWSFSKLIEELLKENRAIAEMRKRKQ